MKKIRMYKGWISLEDCIKYREISKSIQPVNKPICESLTAFEVIQIGYKKMQQDKFVLSWGIGDV